MDGLVSFLGLCVLYALFHRRIEKLEAKVEKLEDKDKLDRYRPSKWE